MDITTIAVHGHMAADSVLVGLLSEFASVPAIFTGKTIPPAADRPYIWTYADITDVEAFQSAKDIVCREVSRDIWIVADDTGDEDAIMEIANRVRDIFHRAVLTIGKSNMRTLAQGPRLAPSEGEVTARIVTVAFVYET